MAAKDTYQAQHLRNITALQKRLAKLYGVTIEGISTKCRGIKPKGDKPFSFADFPAFAKEVDILLRSLGESLEVAIVNGVRASWTLANNKDNEIGRAVLGERISDMTERQVDRYFNNRESAIAAFIARKTGGLNLSDRVWKYTDQYRTEIELGLDMGLREGKSAQAMARDLKEYLEYPDKLFRRVRDERGILHLSKSAAAFHPGNGVYRSSYKNALRLAVTEINTAYHTADYERWQDMDFIVGIEVRLSGNHTVLGADGKYRQLHDICDELQGRYPKDFKFTGWHPNCRCQAIPIFKTDEELDGDLERELAGEDPIDAKESENAVKELPENFTDWVDENTKRIESSAKKGTLPYFLRDNQEYKKFLYRSQEAVENKTKTTLDEVSRKRRSEIRKIARKEIAGQKFVIPEISTPTSISNRGIKEWLNQPHKHYRKKNEALLRIKDLLGNGKYLGFGIDEHEPSIKVHLVEIFIANDPSWIIIREAPKSPALIYSISDNKSILTNIKKAPK